MSKQYFRPIVQTGAPRPDTARAMPCAPGWFTHVELLARDAAPVTIPADEAPLVGAGKSAVPRIMGILNVTPDSFSDGGELASVDAAVARARAMVASGVDILDVGGESTRPGADFVPMEEEIRRTVPVIEALRMALPDVPISIDTRKAEVAGAALKAGATLFNDVSALTFDAKSAGIAAQSGAQVCLMHASGDPKTMQADPQYDDVLLDVYDYLEARRDHAVSHGVQVENIILDPGIGFGKTVAHNLALVKGLSLFHMLGCTILLGASRKRFIGVLTDTDRASHRVPGSLAVALEAARQGAGIIRVHDVAETRQALTIWQHLAT